MPTRLKQIHDELSALIQEYQPQEMAVESLFYFKNQKTVMTVSQGRGVILLVGEEQHQQIFEYTPLQVKMGVTGYGRAEKKQVQQMVKLIMGLAEIPKT
jgi:crossover junction endodeoxyribonuclease RuvC